VQIRGISFGTTAAVMTSMGLVVGLGSANMGKPGILAGLLVIGIADNLSDTLGLDLYEESESGASGALGIAVSNYFTRLVVVCTFVGLVIVLPLDAARVVSIVWGSALLSLLTYWIATVRGTRPVPEIAKHLVVAGCVIALSHFVGMGITKVFSG
jgi:hypothetical protein